MNLSPVVDLGPALDTRIIIESLEAIHFNTTLTLKMSYQALERNVSRSALRWMLAISGRIADRKYIELIPH